MAPNMRWLKADLQDHCQAAGIPFNNKDTKQDLLYLIQDAGHGNSTQRGSSGRNHQTAAMSGEPSMGWLKVDLQAYCNRNGIPYIDRHTKQQLLDMIFQGCTNHSKAARHAASSGGSSCNSEPSSAASKQPSMRWLKADLQAYCDQRGIDYKARDTKQQLLDLIQGAVSKSPARQGSYTSSDDSGSCCESSCSAPAVKSGARKKTNKGGAGASLRTDTSTATATKVVEKSSVWVCNAVGTTCDKMPGGWRNAWSEVTSRQPGRCVALDCNEEGRLGGHVYMKGQGKVYCFIAPICYHHNSSVYSNNGFSTEWYATKPNTAFMRILAHACHS